MTADFVRHERQFGKRRVPRRRGVCFVLSVALLVLVFATTRGCPRTLQYAVVGQVRALDTGKPLPGVRVHLEERSGSARGERQEGEPVTTAPKVPVTTDLQGGFFFSVFCNSRTLAKQSPRWWVVLSKRGYEPKKVDISPAPKEPPSKKTEIRIVVYLRPSGE